MKRKTGKLDPARLQAALDAPCPDPLDPKMVDIVKDLFKPEVAERYIKSALVVALVPNAPSKIRIPFQPAASIIRRLNNAVDRVAIDLRARNHNDF